jgi:hypothetical protein
MKLVKLSLLAALAAPLFAATDNNFNSWFVYNGDHAFGKSRWGLHEDGQWRRYDGLLKWQQYQIRPGVNYQLTNSTLLTFGYAFTETFRYGDYPVEHRFHEHRIYEQALYTRRIYKLNFGNRFRLEQRYFGQPVQQSDGSWKIASYRYENRFRYRLQTNIPLSFGDKRNYIAFYDEIMFNFGHNVYKNNFDQNRAFIGFGRHLGHETNAEFGFMEQTLQRRGGEIYEHNHTVQVVINWRLPFGK